MAAISRCTCTRRCAAGRSGLKAQELGLKVGFALVIGMALIATFNDIKLLLRLNSHYRWGTKGVAKPLTAGL